ncbi:MAG: PAS domain S-box protein [Leptospiraceae bacterium]|nr:PAS domain S-box protein [Leptospiraceae bacterium]
MLDKTDSEFELDFLFEESVTAISYTDSNGIFLKANSAYVKLFSFSKEELIGKDISIHLPNSDFEAKSKLLQDYKVFYATGKNDFREESIFTKTGELKAVEITRKFILLSDHSKICVSFLTDVSSFKRSNEKILNAVFNALSGVIYHVRLDALKNRKMIFISERADVIFGYSSQELQENIGLIANVIHPDDILTPSQSLEIFRKNNNFRRIQYRAKDKTGGWKWLEERSILIESRKDEYDLYGMITDISESKLSSKRLEDLRFALDQSSVISITDKDGNIIDFNENFCKISGYNGKEILGQNHRIINSGFHPRSFFTEMWNEISSGKVWEGEIKNMRKDGTYYWVYSHIIPFLDDHGKPFQYISIRNEITQRKEAEEKLAASEEKYRLLYENAPIGIVIVDPEATILECNNYLLKLLGYSREEMIGKKSFSFIHEDFIEFKANALQKLFSGEIKRFYIEEKRKTKEGNYIWVGCYSNAITDKYGKIIYRLDFVTDIENKKRTEEGLLKLDQSKNAILNIVAHDLRTPISGITNLARLMLKKEKDEECQKYLKLMEDSGHHSMTIIQDILEISQLEQEISLDHTELTELNSFLRDCIYVFQLQAKQKSVKIQFRTSVEKIFHDINRDKMRRVFTNLISNAIKFSYEQTAIEIYLYRESQRTIIKIQDHGIGISPEMQSVLFEKFSPARRVGTKGEHSIGLGMSIVKEIIDKHKAKIRIESEENKGTSVYIEL